MAEGDTRTLSMHHMHTGESITITYKRDGRYDDDALQKLNWFLRDWRRSEQTRMDPHLLDVIWEVNREVEGKDPIEVVCGYRSPETNAMLRRRSHGVAQYSQHMLGHAMDFYIPGVPLEQIRFAGLRLQRGGVGFYPTSGSPFVHLDTGNVRHWPRMTHDQLVRVFPDGKTVHIPTDGRPLSGYALALAEIERRGGAPSAKSLNAARVAGVDDASTGKPKRSLLARLFGFGNKDEQEDDEAATEARGNAPATGSRVEPRRDAPVFRTAQATMTVPLPSARRPQPASQPAQYELSSTSQSPVELDRNGSSDSQDGSSSPGAVGGNGQRFQWLAGPPGRPVPPASVPTHEQPIELAETTSSVAPWPMPAHNDRVPPELALAYAATPEAALEPARPLGPMGTLQSRPAAALTPPPSRASTSPRLGQRIEDPWLRGVVMAPSVHYSMSVAVIGLQDFRTLRVYMQKPHSVVAMDFASDPQSGMNSEYFAGSAVAFLPTVTFGTRTAGLE